MNNRMTFYIFYFIFSITFTPYISAQQGKDDTCNPKLEMGIATISGKIINLRKNLQQSLQNISIYTPNLITGITNTFEIPINEDKSFIGEIPVSISPEFAEVELCEGTIAFTINLMPNEETKLEIICNENEYAEVRIIDGSKNLFVNPKQKGYTSRLVSKIAKFSSDNSQINSDTINKFITHPAEYVPYFIRNNLEPRLEIIEKDSILDKKAKAYYRSIFKLFMFRYSLLDTSFKDEMIWLHDQIKTDNNKATAFVGLEEPDKSYYGFLKDLDLNNPQHLHNMHYPLLCQSILSNRILDIPQIGETPISEWISKVRDTMTSLLGFDKGQFYDILTANAYSKQFIDEMKPLSDKQIQNIENYYGGEEIKKIILLENEKIIKFNQNRLKTSINKTPSVLKEELIESIISRYRGKVIIVDFWATWCAPCLVAIAKSHEMKAGFLNKDVVFVYITSESSPKKVWVEKIKGIGGEHYYLTQEEWEYLLDSFNFNAIPTYLFYDKEGRLKELATGFSNTDIVRKKIEELLPE